MNRQSRRGRVRDIRGNPVLLVDGLYVRTALLLKFKRCEGVCWANLLLLYEYFEPLPRRRVVLSLLQESIPARCPTQTGSEYANWTTEDARYTVHQEYRTIHTVQVGDQTTGPNQSNRYIQRPLIILPIKTQPSISKIWIAFGRPPKYFQTGSLIPQQLVAHRPPSPKSVQ